MQINNSYTGDSKSKNLHYFQQLSQVMKILLALNKMGLIWSSLSVELQRGLLASVESNMKQFNPQDISNILLVLSRMVVLDER